jgi:hypothetical protein
LALILTLLLFSLPATALVCAPAPPNDKQHDSAANAACIKALQTKRDSLSAIIKKEDAKRNTQLNGVSAEVLEEMNDRQDSVCLDLRSQLVDVQLEIWERSKGTLPTQLKQQLNAGKK